MNRKPVIFLSSTYFDLKKARSIAIDHLTRNQYIFSGMEAFFVLPMMEQWENIKRTIEDCDIYVAVLGERFGCVAHEGRSCTELECEYAAQIGKPIIALIQEKKHIFKYWQSAEHSKKQTAFKDRIVCDYKYTWSTYDDLITNMFKGILTIEQERHIVGYGRPIFRETDFTETPKGFRLKFEYSDNTMAWDKKKLVHDEIFYYDVESLSHNVNEIMKENQVNPEIAIYCFLKHYILQKFKGQDIVSNGLFVHDHDIQNALRHLNLE